MAIEIPPIDPVALQLGPLVIRWYALAYLAGFLLGWKYCLYLVSGKQEKGKDKDKQFRPNSLDIDDFLVWVVVGVVLGGRIGYVLFYQFEMYVQNPLEILQIWHGGMSFHGGALGVIAALVIFSWRRKISLLALSDIVCAAVPIGLFFGRIANFVNGELVGRQTTLSWGVIFPDGSNITRHPSQIYEALLEGLVLFLLLFIIAKKLNRAGVVTGVFLMGYAVFRAVVEFVRQPDSQIGLIYDMVTMGQILCLPMFILGIGVCIYASSPVKSDESSNKITAKAE